MNENLYIAHTNFHTKPCMFAEPVVYTHKATLYTKLLVSPNIKKYIHI